MKRLGLLLPSSGTVQEVDFYRRLPDDVTVHAARMRLAAATEADEIRMLEDHTLPAARDLATIRPDVVVFSCTSAGALRGQAYEKRLCAAIADATGAPVVSTMAAVGEALGRLAVRSVVLVTPYPPILNQRVEAALRAHGLTVSGSVGMDLTDSLAIGAVPPGVIHDVTVEQFRKAPAEALVIACCTFRAFDAKAAIEATLGVPVVTSNHAALEAALRVLGRGAAPA